MSEMDRGSEEIELELEVKRSELDQTARALEQKLSTEHLWEQTRAFVEESAQSAAGLIRRHPIPTAVAAAFLGGEVARRSKARFSSRDDHVVGHLLNELVHRAERGSDRAKSAIHESTRSAASQGNGMLSEVDRAIEHFANELIRRAARGSERAKSVVERTASSLDTQSDGLLHVAEDLLHRAQRAIEREARAVQSLPPRELALVTAVATVLGAAIGSLLVRRR
jgi:hypothetical protein